MVQLPLVNQGLVIIDGSLPHSDTPPSVGRLWKDDQLDAENSTSQHTTLIWDRHPCPGVILTHALDRSTPGIGKIKKTEMYVCMCEVLLSPNLSAFAFNSKLTTQEN